MGMNNLTYLIIATRGDDIKCDFGGPSKKNGKYVGWITLYRNGEYDHELLNTEAIFETGLEAKEHMENLVSKIREKKEEND